MSEEVSYNKMSEIEFLRILVSRVQKHLSNMENTIPMMRNGQFIDAYHRVGATKEGLTNLLSVSNERLQFILARVENK